MMTVGLVGGVALAAVAIVGFIALFQKLMESNEAFREKITAAWAQVKEAFQPAIDAFNTFKESIMGITKTDAFDSFVESFGDGIVGLIDIISEVVGIVADLLSGIFGFLTELWEEHGEGLIEKAWFDIFHLWLQAVISSGNVKKIGGQELHISNFIQAGCNILTRFHNGRFRLSKKRFEAILQNC